MVVNQSLRMWKMAGVTHIPRGKKRELAITSAESATAADAVSRPGDIAAPPDAPSVAHSEATPPSPQDLPMAKRTGTVPVPPAATPNTEETNQPKPALRVAPSLSVEERSEALEVLQKEVSQCTQCSELAATRTQTVFGVGSPAARLVFFGEAPGADEDRLGEPFVGRAGQLLTKIIQACGMERDDVYILNTLKCRPPNNRNPTPDETNACWHFFERQLEIIRPEFICCLGAVSAKALLQTTEPIGRLRGRFHAWRGVKVLATYHPAYLLRNPAAKRDVWEDMKILLREMGMPIPD